MHINHRSRSLTLLAAFAAMWGGSSLSAATIQVPSDARTIQGAVDAASNGDVIIVAAGTWHETINMKGKAIVLKSVDGPEATVLDGRTLPGSIVYCIEGESRETGIEGFTLRGGTGDSSVHGPGQAVGGAMFIVGSSPRVNDCIFENNTATLQGGAVYSVRDAHPSFTNCIFRRNASEKGGAVFSLLSNCRFMDCTFIGNLAHFSGGAIFNSSHCSPTFMSCRFLGNQALYNGGAIYDYESHGSLSRCTFETQLCCVQGWGGLQLLPERSRVCRMQVPDSLRRDRRSPWGQDGIDHPVRRLLPWWRVHCRREGVMHRSRRSIQWQRLDL